MMKKVFFLFSFLILTFLVTGCGQKPMMDEINKQGFYPYHNDTFNFDLSLPKEFQYYQTQRTETDNYIDIDFFVPTADINYSHKAFPNYAQPVIVRVFSKSYYDSMSEADKAGLVKVGEKGKKVFVMKFWDEVPSDWKDKWTDAMKQQIIKNFKLK